MLSNYWMMMDIYENDMSGSKYCLCYKKCNSLLAFLRCCLTDDLLFTGRKQIQYSRI